MTPRKRTPEELAVLQKPYWRVSDAQEILGLWRRSGMSVAAFARSQGIRPERLSRWRGRLSVAEPAVPRFHRVRVVERSAVPGPDGEGVEILLAGGRRVAVRPGFDGDLLTQVIRVLEALPC